MEVILLERIEKLGQMGDIVKVKPGFARNFLLPQGKALRATDQNKSHFDAQRAQLEADNLKRKQEAEAVAANADEGPGDLDRHGLEGGLRTQPHELADAQRCRFALLRVAVQQRV